LSPLACRQDQVTRDLLRDSLLAAAGTYTMQAAAPWMIIKTLPVLRTRLAAASSFHFTPLSSEKWKSKWDCPKVRRPPPALLSSPFHNPHFVWQR
jgi:hypothetical protein